MNAAGFNFLNRAPEKVSVAGKSVVIAGPPGYCIDTSATRDDKSGAFVLLGSCASIVNKSNASTPDVLALLTASVSGENSAVGQPLSQRLERFFQSPQGHAALARDGNAGSIEILESKRHGNAIYLHTKEAGANPIASLSSESWRGLFDVRGRIVTVTVVGFKGRPLSDKAGLETLDAFAARIINENPPMLAAASENPNF